MSRWWPLTVRGTAAVLLAVACVVTAQLAGLAELLFFGVLFAALVAASIVSLHLVRRSGGVQRALSPDVVAVAGTSVVTVRVGVRSALPTAPGRWSDALSPGLRGRAAGVFPAVESGLRGGGVVTLRYRVEGAVRGIHTLGPLAVTATDPFALARRRYRLGERTTVTVAPAIVELAPLTMALGRAGGMLQTAHAPLGQGSDDLIARPYAPGDSMRRVHWRATAHRDELMVRQEEQEASPEATVVLDRSALRWGAAAAGSPGADPAFETGVSACVSAVMRLVHEGYTVEVADSDGVPLAEPIGGGEVFDAESLATAFATVTTRPGDDLAGVPGLFAGAVTGPVVVVAGALGVADAEVLAPLVHRSALPVLLAVDATAEAIARARAAGWHAAGVAAAGDVPAAWESAISGGAAAERAD